MRTTVNKLTFIVVLLISFFTTNVQAQVSFNINIGSRPAWCNHYSNDVEYFYYPEIEAYYEINTGAFIYFDLGDWVRSRYLPEYCEGYDYRNAYKVAIDYRGYTPYAHFKYHRNRYYNDRCRNYREEYYNPRKCNNYVANYNRNNYNDYYDRSNEYNRREGRNDDYGHQGRGHWRR